MVGSASETSSYRPSGALSPYQAALLAAWELNESGGARSDSGPSNLALTDNNTTPFGGSIVSVSRRLDGTTQYFTVPDAAAYRLNSGSYTLMAWFYKDIATGTGTLVSKRTANGAGDWEYVLYAHNSQILQFLISNNAGSSKTANGSNTVAAKTWNCAFAWYDATNLQINTALNGNAANTPTSTSGFTPTTNTANVSFGAVKNAAGETYTNFVGGRLGAVAGFTGVLTSQERSTLYNSGYALQFSELPASLLAKCAWFVPFNQTSGNETDAVTSATVTALNTPTARCGAYRTAQDLGSARFIISNSERLSRTGGSVTGIDSYSGNFSIELAFKTDTASTAASTTLFGKGATGDAIKGIWIQKTSADRPQATLGNGTSRVSVTPTNTVTAGALQHWVITVDRSGNMSLYVNGSLGTGVAAASVAGISGDLGTVDLNIGGLVGSTFFEGEIGFTRVYNYVLSSGDVTYLYNSGALRSYANL